MTSIGMIYNKIKVIIHNRDPEFTSQIVEAKIEITGTTVKEEICC